MKTTTNNTTMTTEASAEDEQDYVFYAVNFCEGENQPYFEIAQLWLPQDRCLGTWAVPLDAVDFLAQTLMDSLRAYREYLARKVV